MKKKDHQMSAEKQDKQIKLLKIVLREVQKFQEKKNLKNEEKQLGDLEKAMKEA